MRRLNVRPNLRCHLGQWSFKATALVSSFNHVTEQARSGRPTFRCHLEQWSFKADAFVNFTKPFYWAAHSGRPTLRCHLGQWSFKATALASSYKLSNLLVLVFVGFGCREGWILTARGYVVAGHWNIRSRELIRAPLIAYRLQKYFLSAFSWADIYLNPRWASSSVCQYLVL
jgi:hypothetical protein